MVTEDLVSTGPAQSAGRKIFYRFLTVEDKGVFLFVIEEIEKVTFGLKVVMHLSRKPGTRYIVIIDHKPFRKTP